jgi:hypothetical protein
VNDEFGTGSLDLVGDIEVGIADDSALRGTHDEMADFGVSTVTQVEKNMLGQRSIAVMSTRRVDELEDVEDVCAFEKWKDFDVGHRAVAGDSSCAVESVSA